MSINGTQITFNGGLFDMIEHFYLHAKPTETSEASDSSTGETSEKLIETLTPELLVIHVENTEVKSLNKHNSYHYHLLLQRVETKAKLKSNSVRTRISNLRIYTPAHEVLHLKELTADTKSTDGVVTMATKVDTLSVVYNHEDIHGWFEKIFLAGMKSNRKELIVKAFRMANEKALELYHSEFTQRLFARIVLNSLMELRNMRMVLEMGEQISSINASIVKLHLNQLEESRASLYDDYTMNLIFQKRHWSVELISDAPLCWYMDEKFDYLSSESGKTYIRGSALFIGSMFVRLSSHGDAFKLELRVNTLRTEYSQKLTAFAVKSIKSFKEFVDLFSQLSGGGDEANPDGKKSISIEKVLNEIALDAKVSNVSCFFINRHEVCVFLNLAEFSSIDSFHYVLDQLQVSKVDFTKYDSIHDLSEFSSVYVSTKMLKINLSASDDQPQVCVDFSEKLECSWNAHFLRHLLSLARDFHKFRRNAEDALGVPRVQKSLLPRSLPVGLDIKKLRNIRIKHSDVNVDKLILLINELSGENLFFYHYFH